MSETEAHGVVHAVDERLMGTSLASAASATDTVLEVYGVEERDRPTVEQVLRDHPTEPRPCGRW